MHSNNAPAPRSGGNLVVRILGGILAGLLLALFLPYAMPHYAASFFNFTAMLGQLFVGALKGVAPLLVFVLVTSSIANQRSTQQSNMKPIIVLYLLGTFLAALVAVVLSFAFPVTLMLQQAAQQITPPQGIAEVLRTLVFNIVDNPIHAIISANYIGVLAWAIGLGIALRHSADSTKVMLADVAHGVSQLVRFIISLAPIGIFGIVSSTFYKTGFSAFAGYGHLLLVLLGAMLIIALVVNPIIVFVKIRQNPYPLVLRCLRESGVTAFFTRSSAANIPVNMSLCEKLGLDEDTYSVSIPLGATINMAGAAITITVLSLAAVHTLNIHIDIWSALLLSILAAISACGASGVAGGSLLLIPLACSLFGIPNDIAAQVIGVGFVIGVIQDSAETALNSSTDVVFTAAGCLSADSKPNYGELERNN